MIERKTGGVEPHPMAGFTAAVSRIGEYRVPDRGQMDPDLVGSAGLEDHLEKAAAASAPGVEPPVMASGVAAIQHHRPLEGEDALFLFVGDQAGETGIVLAQYIARCGIKPVAFGYLRVVDPTGRFKEGNTVQMAARHMEIPCFNIDETMFTSNDPYAINRVLRDMIAATPVVKAGAGRVAAPRFTLIEQILKTPLLERPVWAEAA